MKAIAKVPTNIKPMSGGEKIDTLGIGEFVFGDYSSQETDIINVNKIYTKDGFVRRTLSVPCKVFIGNNLIVTNETESETPTEPEEPTTDPDPEPVFPQSYILTEPNGKRAEYVFVRIIEE